MDSINSNNTSFFNRLCDDVMLILTNYCGINACNLSCADKNLQSQYQEISEYYFKSHENRRKLQSISPSMLTRMLTSMDNNTFKKWGKFNSSIDKEDIFRHYCITNNVTQLQQYMTTGVDIDTEKLFTYEKNTATRAGTPPRLLKYTAIQEAVSSNNVEALKFLLDYGANIDQVDRQWFVDSYITIFDYVPLHLSVDDVRSVILVLGRELIKQRNFSFLMNYDWFKKEQFFVPFFELLYSIDHGTPTGFMGGCTICDDEDVELVDNSYFSNGYICCSKCLVRLEEKDNVNIARNFDEYLNEMKQLHYIQQTMDDETVDYNDFSLSDNEEWEVQSFYGIVD